MSKFNNTSVDVLTDASYHVITDHILIKLGWGDGNSEWSDVQKSDPFISTDRDETAFIKSLNARLDELLKKPSSTTERLRYRQWIVDYFHNDPPWRIDLLSRLSDDLVFNGTQPTVQLRHFRRWRDICQKVDEEMLVALRIAITLRQKYPKSHNPIKPLAFHQNLLRILLAWPTFLHPMDQDFTSIIQTGLTDAHIHFGERYPAPLIWRAMMDGRHEPSKSNVPKIWEIQNDTRPYYDFLIAKYLCDEGKIYLINPDKSPESIRHAQTYLKMFGIEEPYPPIRYSLLAERMLLVIGFLRQINNEADSNEICCFWLYVKGRATFMHCLSPQEPGFQAFVNTRKTSGRDLDAHLAQDSLYWLADTGIISMDIRLYHAQTNDTLSRFNQFFRTIMDLDHSMRPKTKMEWRFILSLSKGGGGSQERRFGLRQSNWRLHRTRTIRETKKFLIRYPVVQKNLILSHESLYINCCPCERINSHDRSCGFAIKNNHHFVFNGFDMIASEYGYDVGLMAPIYIMLGDTQTPDLDLEPNQYLLRQDPRRLTRFFHHGEDREHPITSCRVSWEAIEWLGLEGGDRLGHMTFLADDPRPLSIMETQGERLDNLLWLYHVGLAGQSGQMEWLRKEIEELSSIIHQIPESHQHQHQHPHHIKPSVVDLIEAWGLRPKLENEFHPPPTQPALLAYLAFAGLDDFQASQQNRPSSDTWPSLKEHAESAYHQRGIFKSFEYPIEWYKIARDHIIKIIVQRGILIETCPTSNLIIGNAFQDRSAGASLTESALSPNLVLGSDDPSMFKTDLRVESALLLSDILAKQEIPRIEACKRIQSMICPPFRSRSSS
ncbi:MAG: hypothetical protein H7839_16315 [Magnetococcus sp. YQC-5]